MFTLSLRLETTQDKKPENINSTRTVFNSTGLYKSILLQKAIIYEKYHNNILSRKKSLK